MKVLVVSSLYPSAREPDYGVFVKGLTDELERLGHELRYAVSDRRAGSAPKHVRLAAKALGEARRFRPDVVYAHYLVPAGALAAVAASATKAPLVLTAHGRDVRNVGSIPGVGAATRYAVRRASTVIAVSDYLRHELVARIPEADGRIRVVDCGVDLERFRGRDGAEARKLVGWTGEGPFFLCVGTLDERKNVVRLADAFAELGEGSLAFVGDGPARAELESRAGIRVTGRVPHERVADWIAACDILCQPSLVEPFGQALLEGMASERTVVATRVGGPPEFVTDEAGVLVDPGSTESIEIGLRAAAGFSPPEPRRARSRLRARRAPSGRTHRGHPRIGGGVASMHGHARTPGGDRRLLAVSLGLILAFMVAEVVFGFLADSLALLADAGHMLTDAAALGLALLAAWAAALPARGRWTFGFGRAEILAAQANGVTLVVVGLVILVEGIRRLVDPPDVQGGVVTVVALAGVAVNLAVLRILARARRESLNIRGAYLHIATDLAAFIGTAVAGALILLTGWDRFDPIASLLVAGLMFAAAYELLKESGQIFLEAAPDSAPPAEVGEAIVAHAGVIEAHDLHVWTVTSGFPALAAHVLVEPGADCHRIRLELERLLRERFEIDHSTLQVEHVGVASGLEIERPGRREADGLS